jgi:hypothetical protein
MDAIFTVFETTNLKIVLQITESFRARVSCISRMLDKLVMNAVVFFFDSQACFRILCERM